MRSYKIIKIKMIQVVNLTKQERIETIFKNILKKESLNFGYSPQYSVIDDIELVTILKSIEDRIYYISDSPSFEFEGHSYQSLTFKCNSIDDFKKLMDNNSDNFFIIYTIGLNPMVMTVPNIPSISQPMSYYIRGVFVNDPAVSRNKIISQVLDED